ncbi:MAG: DoxX family protein [Alphaproteobacteria bacterium]|nr:DoxX family protein [Alphaproteobacteria bacterium]
MSTVWEPRVRGIVRIVIGLLFLEHGSAKLLGFPHDPRFDHLSTLLLIAGLIELVGGALFTVGLFTRVTAFIMSGEMAVGYFKFHAPANFFPVLNMGDAAILYCFIFFWFFVAGPGAFSLDELFAGSRSRPVVTA